MFAIDVEFLEGRVVAALPSNPAKIEWPIDPARLFMALVAAHFESDGDDAQFAALQWLESHQPGQIVAPQLFAREVLTVFVPVNDRVDDPQQRSKQPRTFPSGFVGSAPLRYRFDEELPREHVEPLRQLLASVVRLGHSASLVRCSLIMGEEIQDGIATANNDTFAPSQAWGLLKGSRTTARVPSQAMRITSSGSLARLMNDYNADAIEQYAELDAAITVASDKKSAQAAKKTLSQQFPQPPSFRRPVIGLQATYGRQDSVENMAALTVYSVFEPTLIPLARFEGNALGLESTLRLCGAMRSTILDQFNQDAPAWVCGHDVDGSPTKQPHLALVPLAHVGSKTSSGATIGEPPTSTFRAYADGHLLGLGIVLPRQLTDGDKAAALATLLVDELGESKEIRLQLGELGNWTLQRETRATPPRALTPETWSRPSRFWASVTPIVLNRHPKTDRRSDLAGWHDEVGEIIATSCEHIGLNRPLAVRVLTHGPLEGIPSSRPHRSGFPLMAHSNGNTRRLQTHAVIEFGQMVQGPVILGAGRFRGYGFCKPVQVI